MQYLPAPMPFREVAKRTGLSQARLRAVLTESLNIHLPVRNVPPLEGVFAEVLIERLRPVPERRQE